MYCNIVNRAAMLALFIIPRRTLAEIQTVLAGKCYIMYFSYRTFIHKLFGLPTGTVITQIQ